MRFSFAWLLPACGISIASGCTVPRPAESYTVKEQAVAVDASHPEISDDAGSDQRPSLDIPDAATMPMASDSGTPPPPPNPLAGDYLVRVDLYGAARTESSGATATAEARTS